MATTNGAERPRRYTSRQRLLTALDCGVSDRVPINTYELAGHNSHDWYNLQPSYAPLMDYIRAHTDCITNWNPVQTGDDYVSHGSILYSSHPAEMEVSQQCDGTRTRNVYTLQTPKGELRRITENDDSLYTTWVIEHWCKSVDDVDRALSVPYEPVSYSGDDFARVQAETGDDGIIMSSLGDPAYVVADLMSFQDYLVWAFEHTEHFARAVEVVTERAMSDLRGQLEACVVDLYRICGPEYMTPPYLPPSFFGRFMVPHVKRMTQIIHEYGTKARLHCHGKIGRVIDMFFETGCDAIDPCEPPPDGDMELDEVKRRCAGHGVCVFGNIELKLLEHGTREQVRQEIRKVMEQAKADGGFVLVPTAGPINIPLSAKTAANYMAMIDAGLEFGVY